MSRCLGEMVVLKYEATSQNRTEACYHIKFEGLQCCKSAQLQLVDISGSGTLRTSQQIWRRVWKKCSIAMLVKQSLWRLGLRRPEGKGCGGSSWPCKPEMDFQSSLRDGFFNYTYTYIYVHIYIYIWYAYFRIAVVGEIVKALALDEDSHHGIFLWTRKCQAWLDSCSLSDCQSLSRHRLMGVVLIICLFEMATATSLARESYVSLVHIFRLPIHSIALKAHIMGLIQGSDCILPQRIDVGKHFIMTGGPEVALLASRNLETLAATNDAGKTWGWNLGHWEEEKVEKRCLKHPYALFRACHAEAIREPYEDMISRVSSFGRYLSLGLDGIELIAYSNSIGKNEKDGNHDVRAFDEEAFAENPRFDLKQLPVVEKLFENPKFLKFAKSVCPKEKQILDWRDTGFGTICVVGLMVGQDLDVDVRQGTVHHNCGTLRCTRILSSSTSSFPCPDKL